MWQRILKFFWFLGWTKQGLTWKILSLTISSFVRDGRIPGLKAYLRNIVFCRRTIGSKNLVIQDNIWNCFSVVELQEKRDGSRFLGLISFFFIYRVRNFIFYKAFLHFFKKLMVLLYFYWNYQFHACKVPVSHVTTEAHGSSIFQLRFGSSSSPGGGHLGHLKSF